MKRYVGSHSDTDCAVQIEVAGETRPLDPRLDVRTLSPRFGWGYAGAGPAQLALALCLDALDGDVERALQVFSPFKWTVTTRLIATESWSLTLDEVLAKIAAIEEVQAASIGVPVF